MRNSFNDNGKRKMIQLVVSSPALAAGDTSVVTFNAFQLGTDNNVHKDDKIIGFSIDSIKSGLGGDVQMPVDSKLAMSSSTMQINSMGIFVVTSSFVPTQSVEFYVDRADTYRNLFISNITEGYISLTVRAINFTALAGDIVRTALTFYYLKN